MSVLCIHHQNTDPYFNLAAEEYLLKNYQDDFFMLWRGETSIVIGKHQNALAEINHEFVRKKNINVARRLSGGGTVFHDLGNLNFTFIKNVEKVQEINFKTFTIPVLKALQKLNIEAYTSDRNDLLIDGKKISGNAEHVHKKRVLHHGTLLYESSLQGLKNALKVDLSRFEGKAVQSKRSQVTNITNYMDKVLSIDDFSNYIFSEIKAFFPAGKVYVLTLDDIAAIEKLRDEKYKTWDWIFGYSPRYTFRNTLHSEMGQLTLSFKVEKGSISDFKVSGIKSGLLLRKLKDKLSGTRHDLSVIEPIIEELKNDLSAEKIDHISFLKALF